MKKEIRYRLNGLEVMIHDLHHNAELLKYISFNLHKEPFNLFNNLGLHWIWEQTMSNQIMVFYKVMMKEEKFSFTKIINISKELKCKVNYELLENETKALKAEYDKTDFELVRSKYIAHQDSRVPEIKADLMTIFSLTEKMIKLFLFFSKEFKGRKVTLTNHVVDSFDKIFGSIDEYEWVKAFLIAEQIKGYDTVRIRRIAEVINERKREIRESNRKKRNGG